MTKFFPARITTVEPHSAAARAGLQVGDTLLTINNCPLRDIIDVQIYAAEAQLTLLVESNGQQTEKNIERHYGEVLGLGFATPLFDGSIRACHNNCEFCFVSQMPPGMRKSLYLKDDDYRLSFLHGNYITLTNLTEDDWTRIETQYLSPLYVSVHTSDPQTRIELMRNPRAGEIMQQLKRLADIGVEVHTQAVLVPGRNDGEQLERTITDLVALYPAVTDLTVVPVGLTRWHNANLAPYSQPAAQAVLEQVLNWQTTLRESLRIGFVYPADEWFLRAQVPPPPLTAYDGLLPALIENGVGMVSLFLEHWPALQEHLKKLGGPRQTWVTGTLFAATLRACAEAFTQATAIAVDVVAVENHAFGETITVAGLLTVEDILNALAGHPPGDIIVLPVEIFRGPESRALDNRSAADIQQQTQRPTYVVAQENERWAIRAAT